jgi:large subunit ribosomal protein L24
MKFKKGDTVIVRVGKDKGKKGTITKVLREENRVLVDGLNVWKRHQRPRTRDGKGSVVDLSKSIALANVSLIDPKKSTPTRVGYKMVNGKKVRVARKSGMEI